MLSRGLIAAAIAVYVIVLGCVMMPTDAPAKKLSIDASSQHEQGSDVARGPTRGVGALPYKGAGMQIQRVDWIDKYKQSIDEIAALGCDTVSLVIDTRMENGHTTLIWLDMRKTP